MKILLLGDASNYHASLGKALVNKGHHVTLASDGSRWMNTRRDIDLSRRNGKLGGLMLYARLSTLLADRLKGYDIVHIVSPNFVRLRPHLLAKLLKRIRKNNGAVYLTALGTDAAFVRNLSGDNPALGYSEWKLGRTDTPWALSEESQRYSWLDNQLLDYTDAVYSSIDGAVSALYEYHKVIQSDFPALPLAYGGIPIDIDYLSPYYTPKKDGPVKILFSCHKGREGEKGCDTLRKLLSRIAHDFPDKVEISTPPNMPFDDFISTLAHYDIVCDQLYSYTPATTALMAMAMGVVPISGGEDEFYSFIGEPASAIRPIINISPLDIDAGYDTLRSIIGNPDLLRQMSTSGIDFVRRHNDAALVASRFIDFWNS